MAWIHPEFAEHQRKRFTRSDAYRWQRPDQVDDNAPSYLRKYRRSSPPEHSDEIDDRTEAELHEQRLELARLRLDWELLKLAIKARKAGFDPNQPRDDRGRWADSGFGDLQTIAAGMPRIPRQRPPDSRDRTAIAKTVADWVSENGPAALDTIAKTTWLYHAIPTIRSYLDAPKTLEELQEDLTSKAGYDRHHIVERSAAEEAGYPARRINNPDNIVRIPRMKHWEINAWYQTSKRELGDISPREYLKGKDWDERRRIGLEALRRFGVLAP